MRRVLKSFSECIQTVGLIYNRTYNFVQVKDSFLLKYSKGWIDANVGLTEEEIRSKMTNVDGWDVTIHDCLFEEVEDFVVTWAMTTQTKDEAIENIIDR